MLRASSPGSAKSVRRNSRRTLAMPDLLCPDDHELLPLLADGSGSAPVREHLVGCPSCRQRLQRLQAEVANLRHALGGTPPSGSFSRAPASASDGATGQQN